MKARWYQPIGSRKTSTNDKVVLVEVDEDTAAYDRTTSATRSASTGRTTCRIQSVATS